MQEHILKILKTFDVFSDIPEKQLIWLIEHSELCVYQPGESIINVGEPIDYMFVILEGVFNIRIKQGKQFNLLGKFTKGDVTGALPYSRIQQANGQVQITEETTFLKFHRSHFKSLIVKNYELAEALVHYTFDRVRTFTTFQQQSEKLMALGKLSAGLAHELNNPASAMVRAASELRKHLRTTPEKFKSVIKVDLTNEHIDAVNDMLFSKSERGLVELSLMEKNELEEALAEYLEKFDIDDGFDYAGTLTEYGFTVEDLVFINERVPDKFMPPVIRWVEDVLTTEKMAVEIEEASRRISDLVSSVKVYSHMDQANEKQKVELKKLLKSTLNILNHKKKKKNIAVEWVFPEELPTFYGFVNELNQVWMNILDNALDAAPEHGIVNIAVTYDSDYIYITFTDNGPGIPEEIQNKIFDPFFTTKELGAGTGLGLDVVRKIVDKHEGGIRVMSKPGKTAFEVCFPLK